MPTTPGNDGGTPKPGQKAPGLGTWSTFGWSSFTKTQKPKKPKKGKGGKGRKGRGTKAAKKPKTTRAHAARKPGSFHEQAGAGSVGGTASAILGGKGTAHLGAGHPAGTGLAAFQLEGGAGGFGALPGLTGVLIDLVGEGRVGVDRALAAWQREQERVTNRAWRRPGGLQRMGGL